MAYKAIQYRKKSFFSAEGFTLVEVLITIVIFVFASIAITNLFIGQNSLYQFYTAEVASEGSARRIINRVTESARSAESVLASHDFGGTVYSSDSDTLVLRLATIDASDQILANTFDYFVYYLDPSDNTKLYEQIEANGLSKKTSVTRLFSESVENIFFSYDDADFNNVTEVGMTIDTKETFRNITATTTLESLIKLRNRT